MIWYKLVIGFIDNRRQKRHLEFGLAGVWVINDSSCSTVWEESVLLQGWACNYQSAEIESL